MIGSLLIKLGMIAVTMGVIFWIGWAVPQAGISGSAPAVRSDQVPPLAQPEVPAIEKRNVPAVSSTRAAERPNVALSRAAAKLDLNRATEEELESLPGVGPVLAGRIIEYRQGIGSFRTVDDLRSVKGIGRKKFERVRDLIYVGTPARPAKEGKKAA